jgi:hypothetical protein
MPQDPDQSIVFCVVAGALAVAAGALGVLWLIPGVSGILALLILIRMCWLDDNILNDLLDRDELPDGYRMRLARRRQIAALLFGATIPLAPDTPAQVATRMRAEMQCWGIVLTAGAAALLARHLPFGPTISVLAAVWLFLAALRGADRLSLTLWHVETGRVLTRAALQKRPNLFG